MYQCKKLFLRAAFPAVAIVALISSAQTASAQVFTEVDVRITDVFGEGNPGAINVWAVTEIWNLGAQVTTQDVTRDFLDRNSFEFYGDNVDAVVKQYETTAIDHFNTGGRGRFNLDLPFKIEDDGDCGDCEDFIFVAQTVFNAPADGLYTFGFNSDDGGSIFMPGNEFTSVTTNNASDLIEFDAGAGSDWVGTGITFEPVRGNDDTIGTVFLTAGDHPLVHVMSERGGGSSTEVYWQAGDFDNNWQFTFGNKGGFELLGTPPPPPPPATFPIPDDAPIGGAGTMGVREVFENGTISSLKQAQISMTTADPDVALVHDYEAPTMNIWNSGGHGQFTVDEPDYGLIEDGVIAQSDIDDVVVLAQGTIHVTPEQAGKITFHINTDDGFGMIFPGRDFESATGGAVELKTYEQGVAFQHPGVRGNGDSFGVITLPAGDHPFAFYGYERGGGSSYELSSKLGEHDSFDSDFLLVGDDSVIEGGLIPASPRLVELKGDAFVVTGGWVDGMVLDDVRADILGNVAVPGTLPSGPGDLVDSNVPNGHTNSVVLSDNNGGRPNQGPLKRAGTIGIDNPDDFEGDGKWYFANDNNVTGDVNNYSTGIFGKFGVDNHNGVDGETITLTFALISDDNAELEIFGGEFVSNTNGELRFTDDFNTSLACECRTGNTNTFGVIDLVEGEYDFQGFHLEDGGGSHFSIWFAEGEFTGFDANFFSPLSIPSDRIIDGNMGLALVERGGGGGPSADFDGSGTIDAPDFRLFAAAFGTNNAAFDLTGDGNVGVADQQMLQGSFGQAAPSPAAVPEPSTIVLALLGLVGLVAARFRRRR